MKYRKLPVIIDAVQWTGGNYNEIVGFMGEYPKRIEHNRLRIKTLEGAIYADELDYIIRGISGEYYPCKPDIFALTYEKA